MGCARYERRQGTHCRSPRIMEATPRRLKFELITDSRFEDINQIDAMVMVLDSLLNVPEIRFEHGDKEHLKWDDSEQYRVTYYIQKEKPLKWNDIYALV